MSQSYQLPAVIDSASVAALKSALLEHRGTDLSIDASAVQRIGGLGLQVLLSAARTWSAEGRKFGVTGSSESFNEMLRLTGAASLPEFAA
jgi:chemotaxis protein CheX